MSTPPDSEHHKNSKRETCQEKGKDIEPLAPLPDTVGEGDGPYKNTRSKVDQPRGEAPRRGNTERSQLYPLREVPMGGAMGGIGYINVPLTAAEVKSFKKETKNLLEDPIGLSDQLDLFLGPSIYTWGELNHILRGLFTTEERQMIRSAGMKIWEREHQQGPGGENKMPIAEPQGDPNDEGDRWEMEDYHNLIVHSIKEAVPWSVNTRKAFESQQGRDETPTEWLRRLKEDLIKYSGMDPEGVAGQTLLKVQFVTKAWPDIRRKPERMEGWQEKDLETLLQEAQRIYV